MRTALRTPDSIFQNPKHVRSKIMDLYGVANSQNMLRILNVLFPCVASWGQIDLTSLFSWELGFVECWIAKNWTKNRGIGFPAPLFLLVILADFVDISILDAYTSQLCSPTVMEPTNHDRKRYVLVIFTAHLVRIPCALKLQQIFNCSVFSNQISLCR